MMENIEKKEESRVELLREELRKMTEEERDKKERGEHYNPHLLQIDLSKLNEKDAEIWEKYKNHTLTYKEISQFRANVISRSEEQKSNVAVDITADDIAMKEKINKKEITRDEFLDYYGRNIKLSEFWDYWRKKMTLREEEEPDFSELYFYAYLDNQIEADPTWLEQFAKESEGVKNSHKHYRDAGEKRAAI